jgi:hypothetical protein
MDEEQTTTHSFSYDHEGSEWVEGFPSNPTSLEPNKKRVSQLDVDEPNKKRCGCMGRALKLLDQIIEEEEINDKEFKEKMANASSVKEWEQSIGESWTLFHLKRLKELLK